MMVGSGNILWNCGLSGLYARISVGKWKCGDGGPNIVVVGCGIWWQQQQQQATGHSVV